ncbi:MAG: hypothetical protein AAFQ07_13230, partial [Chloroflexota bacterium]
MQRVIDASYYHDINTDPVLRYSYTYDIMGNRTSETVYEGALTVSSSFTYNEGGQLETAQFGAEPILDFSYDANGNRISISSLGETVTT